jgi:predicted O-methyltransferase YrrM
MHWEYRAGHSDATRALRFLESRRLVEAGARLDRRRGPHPRSVVAYGDYDYLFFLSRVSEEQLTDGALEELRAHSLVSARSGYDKERYRALRELIKTRFVLPGTALSPAMERLLYMLAWVKRPRKVLAIGTFCGYTLAWTAGALRAAGKSLPEVTALDLDAGMVRLARRNLRSLDLAVPVRCLVQDARLFAARTRERFDYLYLDPDDPVTGKGLYHELIELLYPKLAPGCWVVAHDTTFPGFQGQLAGYFGFVRDSERFRASVSFAIDCYGAELSVKR